MDLFCINADILIEVVSYLTPKDTFNLLATSKHLHTFVQCQNNESTFEFLPTRFMNVSLEHSLKSIINKRIGFNHVPGTSFIEKLGQLSKVFGDTQIGIAGSVVVQAITTVGSQANDKFSAGDVDLYCTTRALQAARKMLVNEFDLVLTKISTSSYTLFDTKINHVESYALFSEVDDVITLDEAISRLPHKLRRNAKKRWKFLLDSESKYVLPSNFPFSPKSTSKVLDLIVTNADTVMQTINNFDFLLCMAFSNGRNFIVKDLYQTLQHKARLRCSFWTKLVNAYVHMFLSFKSVDELLTTPHHEMSSVAFNCCIALQAKGVFLPDKNGNYSTQQPTIDLKYCAILHHMIVKQLHRIVKYNRRGFDIVGVEILDYIDPNDNEKKSSPTSYQFGPKQRSTHHDIGVGDPTKRAKLRHNVTLSSTVKRAKMRHLDYKGINTSSFTVS